MTGAEVGRIVGTVDASAGSKWAVIVTQDVCIDAPCVTGAHWTITASEVPPMTDLWDVLWLIEAEVEGNMGRMLSRTPESTGNLLVVGSVG